MHLNAIRAKLPPNHSEELECEMAVARKKMDEETLATAWEAGRALTMEQAVEYTLRRGEAIEAGEY